jgi:hypothetical protein
MEREFQQFEFNIIRILDCGFAIEELIGNEPSMNIGYGMSFVFSNEKDWIQFTIRADFKQNNTNIIFFSGTVSTRFGVNNLKQFENDKGEILFPEGSLEMLFGIAFSHMRSILAKNVAGSRFSNIIVPIINPTILFNELLQGNIKELTELATSHGTSDQLKEGINNFRFTEKYKGESPVKLSL